jgi:hypothetical protein
MAPDPSDFDVPSLAEACDTASEQILASLLDVGPGVRICDVPTRFQLEGCMRGAPVRVESRAATGDPLSYARITRMNGGSHVQALNALWWPEPKRVAPPLMAECLAFRGHLHLLLIDAPPLTGVSGDRDAAANLAETWSNAFEDGALAMVDAHPPPDWGGADDEPFGSHVLFAKPGANASIDPRPALELVRRVTRQWTELVASSPSEPERASARLERRATLLSLHRRYEPTADFLGKLADDETIREMTRSYLYPTWLENPSAPKPDWCPDTASD